MTKEEAFDILGINYTSDKKNLKKVFRGKVREDHPDIVGEIGKEITAKRIEAYKLLSSLLDNEKEINNISMYNFHDIYDVSMSKKGELFKKILDIILNSQENLSFEDFWITKDGRLYRINEMALPHLKNTVNYLKRNRPLAVLLKDHKYLKMLKEIEKRESPAKATVMGSKVYINFGSKK